MRKSKILQYKNDIEAFSIHQALKEGNKLSQAFISKRKVTGTHLINGILYAIQIVLISFTHTVLGHGN
jgi:hypothetical protein